MTDAQFRQLLVRVKLLERRLGDLTSSGGAGAHANSHSDGGSDEIDVTDLGGYPGGSTTFLRADGTFATPSGGAVTEIEEQTPSGTGTLTFSSLGSHTHLEIRYSGRSDRAAFTADDVFIRFNGDTGSNYDTEILFNNAATTAAAFEELGATSGRIAKITAAAATSGRPGGGSIRIHDYRGTTFHKTATAEAHNARGASFSETRLLGVTWRSTSAITSVTLFLSTGNFESGTKFTLYGYS